MVLAKISLMANFANTDYHYYSNNLFNYTTSKNVLTFFCYVSVKYKPILIKIGLCRNKHLTKLYIKCQLNLKYVLENLKSDLK